MASAEAAINRKRKRHVKHLSFPSHFFFAIFNLLSEYLLFLLRSLFELKIFQLLSQVKYLLIFIDLLVLRSNNILTRIFITVCRKLTICTSLPTSHPLPSPLQKKPPLSRIQHTSLLEKVWRKTPVQLANLSKRGSGQSVFQ